MTNNGLPDEVLRFLATHINSIEQLEVLMLLRSKPGVDWTAAEVTRELSSSLMSIQARLSDLASRMLVIRRGAGQDSVYRYAPEDEATLKLHDAVEKAYKQRRITVINFIYERPIHDVQSFADAFSLGKKEGQR